MLQNTIHTIEESKHIALLLPQNPTLDSLIAAEVLARALETRSKNIGFLAQVPLLNAAYFPTLSASPPLPRDFIISINTSESPVAQLKYEKNEGTLDVILSPKRSEIKKEHIAYREGNIQCDSAIILGSEDADAMAYGEDTPPDFFTKTPLIRISNKTQKNEEEYDFIDARKSSLCEMIYALLSVMDSSLLDKENASLLLTGIISETKKFTDSSTGADTFLAASELMRLGASKKSGLLRDTEEPAEKPSLDIVHLWGRAIVRSKYHEEHSLFISFLTPEDFEKTHAGKDIAPAVLASLGRILPHALSHVLLWQTAHGENIHVIATGQNSAFGQAPFTRKETSSFSLLEKMFSSFSEAEEQVMRLIAQKL